MQKDHAKTIKGLSIACIAISAALIVLYILSAILCGAAGSFVDYYGAHHGGAFDFDHGYNGFYGDFYGDYDDATSYAIASGLVGLLVGICVFGAIGSAVTLVASIMTLRSSATISNYGKVFGWSIAGAIVGFFTSGVVLTVLFILIAVFSNMDKKAYAQGTLMGSVSPAPTPVNRAYVPPTAVPTAAPEQMPTQAPVDPVSAPASTVETTAAPVEAKVVDASTNSEPAQQPATPASAPQSDIIVVEEIKED